MLMLTCNNEGIYQILINRYTTYLIHINKLTIPLLQRFTRKLIVFCAMIVARSFYHFTNFLFQIMRSLIIKTVQ